jgi:hypothetical protein
MGNILLAFGGERLFIASPASEGNNHCLLPLREGRSMQWAKSKQLACSSSHRDRPEKVASSDGTLLCDLPQNIHCNDLA